MAGSQPLFSTKRINLNYRVELIKTKIHKNKKNAIVQKNKRFIPDESKLAKTMGNNRS